MPMEYKDTCLGVVGCIGGTITETSMAWLCNQSRREVLSGDPTAGQKTFRQQVSKEQRAEGDRSRVTKQGPLRCLLWT